MATKNVAMLFFMRGREEILCKGPTVGQHLVQHGFTDADG